MSWLLLPRGSDAAGIAALKPPRVSLPHEKEASPPRCLALLDVSDCPLAQLRTRQAGEKRPPDEHFWARRSVGTSSRVLTLAPGKLPIYRHFSSGRGWVRTSDLSRVRRAL